MQKEFLYEATKMDNPFDMIERDIAMFGEEFLKSMDDSEFLLNYGMSRREYLFDYRSEIADYSSNKLEGIRRQAPFTEQSLTNLIEGYKSETIKHLSAVKITTGKGPGKNPSELQLNNRTSVRPSALKQKIGQKAEQQINQVQEAVSDTVEDVKGDVGDIQQTIKNNINKATESVGNKIGRLKGLVTTSANQATKSVTGKVNEVGKTGDKIKQKLNQVKKAVDKQAKKLPYPASNTSDSPSLGQKTMKKEFATLKKALLREARGPFARKMLNLREKALKNAMLEEGISYGSPEFTELAERFFPGIQIPGIPATESSEQKKPGQDNAPDVKPDTPQQESEVQPETESQETTSSPDTSNSNPQPSEANTETQKEQQNISTPVQTSAQRVQSGEQHPPAVSSKQKKNAGQGGGSARGGRKEVEADFSNAKAEMVDMTKAETLPEGQDFVQGLKEKKPTSFLNLVKNSEQPIQSSQEAKQGQIAEKIPEIETPTGLEAGEEKTNEREKTDLTDQKSDFDPKAPVKESGNKIFDQIVTPTPIPTAPLINQDFGNIPDKDEAITKVKEMVSKLPVSDESINTSPGTAPSLPLTGEADPAQAEQSKAEAEQEAQTKKSKADIAASIEVPTESILPPVDDEQLTTEIKDMEAPPAIGQELELPDEIPAEAQIAFDKEAQAHLDEQAAEEYAKNEQALTDLETESDQERQNALDEIDTETERTRQEQLDAQNQAKAETDQYKADWKKENEAVIQDFETQAQEEYGATQSDIDQRVADANAETQTIYQDAESEAESEQVKAEQQAEEERSQAENKEKSWWDKLTDAVSSFFDKLKNALNAIFDALRAAVKKIIDAAKKLAAKVIDMARDFIVRAIKVFGEVLKKLVSVALAAFPELAKKFNDLIDKAVNAAVEIVNKLAEGLKAIVNALLDALGAVLDAILAAYQAVFNAILAVLEFIAVGIIKILKGIANLVLSAIEMPGQFMGQLSEEFLGMNVFEPLPFEKTAPSTESVQTPAGENTGTNPENEIGDFLSRGEYFEDDFQLDQLINDLYIPPEVLAEVPPDGELEFGQDASNTMDAYIAATLAEAGAVSGNVESGKPEEMAEAAPDTMNIPEDPYAQVDWFINYQNSVGGGTGDSIPDSAEGQAASNDSIPDSMKLIGPLNPGARLYYLKEQMINGIKQKWQQNKVKYIAIGAAVVAGITALLIATGGAILTVIPPAFQIFAAIMLGAAAVKAGQFFTQYLKEGFLGNLIEGAKGLARAIGIILVELLFILLFDSAALMKTLKTFAKSGIKGVVNMAKTAIKSTFKALGAGLKATGKGFIKQASKVKFFVKNIGKNIGRGAKNIDDFGKRLASKLKFKGFKIKMKGLQFSLYGNINPWVLLANGRVEKRKGPLGGRGNILDDAIVLNSRNKSRIATILMNNEEAGQQLFQLLSRNDVKPADIIKALDKLGADDALDLIKQLNQFKNVDEKILRQAIEEYRISSGIPKHQEIRPGTLSDEVTGGTVGTGKADFGNPKIDDLTPDDLMGRSPNAFEDGSKVFNERYLPDMIDPRALNHAEQTIVGNLANKIDEVFSGVAKSEVKGTLKMVVDQPVCSACRHGLGKSVGGGPLKKFSLEFPNVKIIISNPETSEILIIKAGKILTK